MYSVDIYFNILSNGISNNAVKVLLSGKCGDPSGFFDHDAQYNMILREPTVFGKIFNVELLPSWRKEQLACRLPDLFGHLIDWNKCSKGIKYVLAANNPTAFETLKVPLDNLSGDTWIYLIKHDAGYADNFLTHCHTILNKSNIRQLFADHPWVFDMLEEEHIENMNMSAKEWIAYLAKNTRSIAVSEKIYNLLETQLTTEVLADGNGTVLTDRLQGAMKKLKANIR